MILETTEVKCPWCEASDCFNFIFNSDKPHYQCNKCEKRFIVEFKIIAITKLHRAIPLTAKKR